MKLPLTRLLETYSFLSAEKIGGVFISQVRLLPDEPNQQLQPETLYLTRRIPENLTGEQNAALLVLGKGVHPSIPTLTAHEKSLDVVMNLVLDELQSFSLYSARIHELIASHSFSQLMQLFSEIMNNEVYLVDQSFKVLAINDQSEFTETSWFWKQIVRHGFIPYSVIDNMRKDGEIENLDAQTDPILFTSKHFLTPFITYNMRDQGRLWGRLFVVGYRKTITPGDLDVTVELGESLNGLLTEDISFALGTTRRYEYFMRHLLSSTLTDKDQIKKQARLYGWDAEGNYSLARLSTSKGDERIIELLRTELESKMFCWTSMSEGDVIALVPVVDFAEYHALIERLSSLSAEHELHVGISDMFKGLHKVADVLPQTTRALQAAEVSRVATYGAHAIRHLLEHVSASFIEAEFLDPAVLLLMEHDAKQETEYVRTLDAYLQHERNLVKTARALFIHRNTLVYRIGRIEEIAGIDWSYASRQRILLSIECMKAGLDQS